MSCAISPTYATEPEVEQPLNEIQEHEIHIMPFDLEKTLHVFTKTDEGGMQQVVTKNKHYPEQIPIIRRHLFEIYTEFNQGDFSKSMQIYGENMPGLTELESAKAGQIKIKYMELPNGAQINYLSDSPRFIEAIHKWLEAQFKVHPHQVISEHTHNHKLNRNQ